MAGPPIDPRGSASSIRAASGRIRAADRMSESTRIGVMLQPLRVPRRDLIVARVRALLATGADARVGRTLGDTRWSFDPAGIELHAEGIVRALPEGFDDADLPRLRDYADPSSPLTVFLGDDRVAVHVDHRVGDGFFAVMAVAALLGGYGPDEDDAPATPRVFTSADDRDPLPAALQSTFVRHPGRVWRIVRDKLATPAPSPAAPAAVVPAARGSLDLHTATMSPENHRALAHWSRGRVAPTVALLAAFRSALLAEGIPTGDTGILLVDLRRYLPSGRSTLANFVTGYPVDLSRGVDAAGATVHRDLSAGRPLAAHAAGRLPAVRPPRPAGTVSAAALPIISDMGFLRALEPLPWNRALAPPSVAVSVDPAARNGITALTSVLRGRFGVSFSFDSTLFPADLVASAGDRLCTDPLELLPR